MATADGRSPIRALLLCLVCIGTLVGGAAFLRSRKPATAKLLGSARDARSRGDSALAISLVDKALARSPGDSAAILLKAQLESDAGRIDAAVELLEQVPATPADVRTAACLMRGMLLKQAWRWRAAESAFQEAASLSPGATEPLLELADMAVRRMEGRKAHDAYGQLRKRRRLTIEELSLFTMAGRITNPVAEHIRQLEEVRRADPADATAAVALAKYFAYLVEPSKAIAAASEALRISPGDLAASAVLIEAHLAEGHVEKAKAVADAIRPAEGSAELLAALGGLAMQRDDWSQAKRHLTSAVALDPDEPRPWYRLAETLQRTGDPAKAAECRLRFQTLQKLPSLVFAAQTAEAAGGSAFAQRLTDVGSALLDLGRSEEANEFLSRAVAVDSSNATARSLLESKAANAGRTSIADDNSRTVATSPSTQGVEPSKAVAARPAEFRFRDVAAEKGVVFQYFNGESSDHYIAETLGGGVGVLDFDGDGLPDLFFPQGTKLPWDGKDHEHSNQIFRHGVSDTFENVTRAANLQDSAFSLGCSVGDYDNDGFQDLFVTNVGEAVLHRNNGDGTFTDVTKVAGVSAPGVSSSAVFADLDGDGDLDLFVVHYVDRMTICKGRDGKPVVCHPRDLDPSQSLLFENLGDGRFSDATKSSGVAGNFGKGLGVVAADLDDDGRPDLFVSNDTMPNLLFQNRVEKPTGGLKFNEVGWSACVAVAGDGGNRAGMGIACGDFAGAGRRDLCVTNFFAESCTLYLNHGKMLFSDSTARCGLAGPTRQMLGFGAVAVDADLDGRPDLVMMNGHIYDNRHLGEPLKMRPQAFSNLGWAKFAEVPFPKNDYMSGERLGRGLAVVDFDGDGRSDLVATHLDQPVALLHNETPNAGRSIAVDCIGVRANRDGLHVRLRAKIGGLVHVVENFAGGYLSSNQSRVFLGLGSAESVDELTIEWTGGGRDVYRNVKADQHLTVVEGRPEALHAVGLKRQPGR